MTDGGRAVMWLPDPCAACGTTSECEHTPTPESWPISWLTADDARTARTNN